MTKRSVKFRLPFPPSVNNYWGNRVIAMPGRKPFVQTYIKPKARQFRVDVEAAILKTFGRVKPSTARLAVSITATMPDRRKRDLSNLLKASEDAIQHAGAIADDYQIDCIEVIRGGVAKPGWLDVEMTEIREQTDV